MHGARPGYGRQQRRTRFIATFNNADPAAGHWRRMGTIALHAGLAIILASAAGVGYYTGGRYHNLVKYGYVGDDIPELSNSIAFINTVAAFICLAIASTTKYHKIPLWLSLLIAFNAYFAFTGLWSGVLLKTLYFQAKAILYLYAIYCAVYRLGWIRVYRSVCVLTLAVCISGLYISYSNPEFRTWVDGAAYRGLFFHKNALGAFSLFSGLFILSGLRFAANRTVPLAAFAAAALSVLMSNSKTAMAMMLLSAVIYVFMSRRHFLAEFTRSKDSGFIYACIFVLVGLFSVINAIYGDSSLTGRTNAWAWFISDLGNDLLFGMGGLSFPKDPAVMARAASIGYQAIDSSYIFVLYNVGFVGFCFFAFCILSLYREAHRFGGMMALGVFMLVTNYAVYGAVEASARLSTSMPTACLIMMLTAWGTQNAVVPSPARPARQR